MRLSVVPVQTAAALSIVLTLLAGTMVGTQVRAQSAPAQTPMMRGYPKVGEPPVVTLREPGTAPRKPLRYIVAAGQKARMEVTTSGSLKTATGGASIPGFVPTMKLTVDLAVTEVTPNGDMAYEVAFVSVAAEASAGMTAQELQLVQERLPGPAWSIKGHGTVSARGITTSHALDLRDPALKVALFPLTSSLEYQFTPFPEEAVGVGARWEVRQARASTGPGAFHPTIFEQADYEVLSIEGSTVVLRVRAEQTGPSQLVHTMPSAADMTIERMEGDSLGVVSLRLDSLVANRDITSTTATSGTVAILAEKPVRASFSDRFRVTFTTPGTPPVEDTVTDVTALRGIKIVNLTGTATSSIGPDRLCYPRPVDRDGVSFGMSLPMGGLLSAATWELKAAGIDASGRSTDFLHIDAQIRDAAQCKATVTLELRRGLGKVHETRLPSGEIVKGYGQSPVVWRRTFEIAGAPAGFSSRVIDRFKLLVDEFGENVARARK